MAVAGCFAGLGMGGLSKAVFSAARSPRWRQCYGPECLGSAAGDFLACVGIFSWAGSGKCCTHPLMSFLQERPATMAPRNRPCAWEGLRSQARVAGRDPVRPPSGAAAPCRWTVSLTTRRACGHEAPRYWHAADGGEVGSAGTSTLSLAAAIISVLMKRGFCRYLVPPSIGE